MRVQQESLVDVESLNLINRLTERHVLVHEGSLREQRKRKDSTGNQEEA